VSSTAWWTSWATEGAASARLICFPYAGASAWIYRSWQRALVDPIQVIGIQLPGHGNRIAEPLRHDMHALIGEIGTAIAPLLDRPCAFFGHSLGAVLAFEVSRWLRRQLRIEPGHLLVSGRRAPEVRYSKPISVGTSDKQFLAYLSELDGMPADVLGSPELLSLMLPALRADFRLGETYEYAEEPPLSCPITAIGGVSDGEAEADKIDGWHRQTTNGFAKHVLPGNHFFIHSHQRELIALVGAAMRPLTLGAAPART